VREVYLLLLSLNASTCKVASESRLISKTTGRNSHKITDISWLEVVDSLVNSKVELLLEIELEIDQYM